MTELIYPKLSYKLMGILYKVHRELGNSYQERYYQRAVEIALRDGGVSFEKEFKVDLVSAGGKIGHYF